ncbi:MAG: hypothetical protein RL662_962 [Bacteroidota bacterium]|jgi:undecaprenyl-diphosphatase
MLLNTAHEIVEQILPYERDLFFLMNGSDNIFWDSFMWIYSNKLTWIPLALVALGVLVYKIKWQYALWVVLCTALLFILCDQVSAGVIKTLFERYRPTHHPDFKDMVDIVNDYRGGRFGFVSAHAANGFGAAVFFSLLLKYRWLTVTLFTWATITCYSRIYLGVHFISDVLGGMLLGAILGYIVYTIFQYGRVHFLRQSTRLSKLPFYSQERGQILTFSILSIILLIILVSILNFIFGFRLLY